MNEVFETIAEVFEELRSESGEREYSVQTKESEKADKKLKKANREYEKLLTEISAEHKEFLEDYMDIVDHAHFEEQQRAYYQGMIDVIQIFDGLGILKERSKVKELLGCHQSRVEGNLSGNQRLCAERIWLEGFKFIYFSGKTQMWN